MKGYSVSGSSFSSVKKPSRLWYLLPIFLSVIGGLIGYAVLRKRDNKFAKKLLIVGIIVAVLSYPVSLGLYNFLGFIQNTNTPLAVMASSSMMHSNPEKTHYEWLEENFGYSRQTIDSWPLNNGISSNDMLVIHGSENYAVGDVIVYSTPDQRVPIVHRIVKINSDGSFQTKGDNNTGQNSYELSVKDSQIIGEVISIIPWVGVLRPKI